MHCHGNEAPWTDFSQDTARLMADVRAAPSHRKLAGPWPGQAPRHGVLAHGYLSRAWLGLVVPGGNPGCRRRPGAPAEAGGGQHSGVTVPSPPSTPHTASCPRPLQEEPCPTSAPPFPQQPSQCPNHCPRGSSFLSSLRPDTTRCCSTGDSRPGTSSACVSGNAHPQPGTGDQVPVPAWQLLWEGWGQLDQVGLCQMLGV